MYKRKVQGWVKHLDFILWDAFSLQVALIFAYLIRFQSGFVYSTDEYKELAIVMFLAGILVAATFNTMHNVMKRGLLNEFAQTVKQAGLVLLITSLYLFSLKSGSTYSRIVIYLAATFHVVIGYGVRIALKPFIRKMVKNKPESRMILVADESRVGEINSGLSKVSGFEPAGIVLINRDAAGEEIGGIKVVANLSDAADYICREWVDEIFVYPENMSELETSGGSEASTTTVGDLVEQCREMFLPVHIRFPVSDLGSKTVIEKLGNYKVMTITSNYASSFELVLKRMIDLLGGVVGSLFAVLIIMIFGPIIKKESPGPIIFAQTRIGRNGKPFKIYKLRTMYMDAEERKKELMKDNRVSDGMMFKMDWDPRIIGNKIVDGKQVTGIGSFLRTYSIDEFPQFFNVLLNNLSLVGTRPPTIDEWEKYKYHHRARMAFKPGITGMWQVSGRSSITDFEEVVRLDTEYINNWSIGLDIKILFKTVKVVLMHDGSM